MTKPLTLYGFKSNSPNPWKVAIVLEELNIPYTTTYIEHSEVKGDKFTKVNPNGRVPAIEDPNTGITLWESAAIIEYLVDTYDKTGSLTYKEGHEKWQVKQWLYFQMSGQGPYYGQAVFLMRMHPEKVESVIKRYQDQTTRVIGVLDKVLEGKTYLVGDKCTIADLAFIPWEKLVPTILAGQDVDLEKEYPNYSAWLKLLNERPAVKKVFEIRDKVIASAAKH